MQLRVPTSIELLKGVVQFGHRTEIQVVQPQLCPTPGITLYA